MVAEPRRLLTWAPCPTRCGDGRLHLLARRSALPISSSGRWWPVVTCRVKSLHDVYDVTEVVGGDGSGRGASSLAELMVVEQVAHALGDSARARPSRKRGSGAEASEARRDVVLVAALGDA